MSTAYATVVPVTTQTVRPAAREARSETRTVDGVKAVITYATPGVPVTDEEIRAYIRRGNLQNMNTIVDGLNLVVDGEDIEITYDLAPVPFDRIRRITGYLVGSMNRWNDAKTAEEHDRVKHVIPTCSCTDVA
ncbi:MAG: hypothetical protein IJG53_09350 [Eggerthellaceae bacterium]|nr:hypothetical protein [Eggerthellaceae bacterium]